jgi:hypothetical protein
MKADYIKLSGILLNPEIFQPDSYHYLSMPEPHSGTSAVSGPLIDDTAQ